MQAYLSIPFDGEDDVVKIHGNQRQVDYAEELLQKSLFANFSSSKLKLSKHLKSVLLGSIRSIKGDRDVNIQIGDTTHDTLLDCVISGAPEDCMAVCTEILQMLNRDSEEWSFLSQLPFVTYIQ